MTAKRRRIFIGLALATLIAGLCAYAVALSLANEREGRVLDGYQAIRPGMTRGQVRRAVEEVGDVMLTGVSSGEVMHIGNRYMIAVEYEPSPEKAAPKTNPAGRPDDDWIVQRKVLVELGRGDPLDQMLMRLKLRPPRIVEVERLSR